MTHLEKNQENPHNKGSIPGGGPVEFSVSFFLIVSSECGMTPPS